jgi:hypothetical protein
MTTNSNNKNMPEQKTFVNGKQVSPDELDRLTDETRLEDLRKELDVFVMLLNTRPDLLMRATCVYNAGDQTGFDKDRLTQFLFNHSHAVGAGAGAEVGEWSCGFLGSRWVDAPVGRHGETRRLAFYSRKHDPQNFKQIPSKCFLVYLMQ